MFFHGIGQHRISKEHNYTDLALPLEVNNVILDMQTVITNDHKLTPQKAMTFVNVKVVYFEICRVIVEINKVRTLFTLSHRGSDNTFSLLSVA